MPDVLSFVCGQEVWLEQEDAQAISEGEEVTLMDWGNAIVQVRTLLHNVSFLFAFLTLQRQTFCPYPNRVHLYFGQCHVQTRVKTQGEFLKWDEGHHARYPARHLVSAHRKFEFVFWGWYAEGVK